MDKIQQKLKLLKQYFKGWGFNFQGELRKKRSIINNELNDLENIEEINGLDPDQMIRKVELMKENLQLLDQEETYWYNRCHEQWILKGVNNTSYFHRIANGRKRKSTVISLEKDGEIIEGDENLLKHATKYYSDLFSPGENHDIHIDQSLWAELDHVSDAKNEELCKASSELEIKTALCQMEKNKAADPDRIPIEFYQACWDIVKSDIIQLFDDFHANKVDTSRINYGIITLLPKLSDASKIQQFRPICLLYSHCFV